MPARPCCIKTLRIDRLTGERYLPAKRSAEMSKRRPQLKNGQFSIRKVDEKLPDYSKCLNCGGKKKHPKWEPTHFCSLECFANYKKRYRTTEINFIDIAGIRELESELGLDKNIW